MKGVFRDNADRNRFELDIDGQVVFATYRRNGSVLAINHVEAPIPLRGTGAAGALMAGIVAFARAENLRIAPLCSYASAWIRRHREHHSILA
jgi:predicted GNAT family acetyltransferase